MSTFANILNGLNTRLNSLSGLPEVAWPNTKYNPKQNTTWIRPTLLPATSQLYTLKDERFHQGIYQVDIYVPLEKGTKTLYDLADDVRQHFEAQRSLTSGSDTVFIQEVSMSPATRDESWYSLFVSISYQCYSLGA
jgi:hypothetical protein